MQLDNFIFHIIIVDWVFFLSSEKPHSLCWDGVRSSLWVRYLYLSVANILVNHFLLEILTRRYKQDPGSAPTCDRNTQKSKYEARNELTFRAQRIVFTSKCSKKMRSFSIRQISPALYACFDLNIPTRQNKIYRMLEKSHRQHTKVGYCVRSRYFFFIFALFSFCHFSFFDVFFLRQISFFSHSNSVFYVFFIFWMPQNHIEVIIWWNRSWQLNYLLFQSSFQHFQSYLLLLSWHIEWASHCRQYEYWIIENGDD